MNMNDYIRSIYSLRVMKRYNNIFRIKEESIMEHCGFVTAIVLKLNEFYKFKLERAMIIAISHDFGEIFVSDIPYNVKMKYSFLKKALKRAENLAYLNNFDDLLEYHIEFEEQKTIESMIVKLADIISCVQYAESEIALGNNGKIISILEESLSRQNKIIKKLERYKR